MEGGLCPRALIFGGRGCFLWSVTRSILFAILVLSVKQNLLRNKLKVHIFHAVPSFDMSVCQNLICELLSLVAQTLFYLFYAVSSFEQVLCCS